MCMYMYVCVISVVFLLISLAVYSVCRTSWDIWVCVVFEFAFFFKRGEGEFGGCT